MKAHTLIQSYNTYGGHPTFSLVGQLIEEHLSELAHGVAEFECVAHFRSELPPKPTLEDHYSRFHNDLKRLPTSRWETKKGRLVVRYESQIALAEHLQKNRSISPDLLAQALEELIGVLESLRSKLATKKGLDASVFLDGLASLRPHVAASEADLREFREVQAAKRRKELDSLPWDERLEIDWEEYHPDAKTVLNDPFFWSQTNDYSPHGNDTGADLLGAFRSWEKKYPNADSILFLSNLLEKWGLAAQIRRAELKRPRDYSRDEETALVVGDEAWIALAFGEIKLRGSCNPKTAAKACENLSRQLDPAIREELGWREPSQEMTEANRKLIRVLQNYLPRASSRPWWKFWGEK